MAIPNKLGKYIIEGVLGEGAMSVVYKAKDPDLGNVAIKVIRHELIDEAVLERVKREALICRKLRHPNIVGTYDFNAGDPCYIVMELIEGRELKEYFNDGYVFSDEAIYQIVDQMLSALAYAHKEGITHRDIKPANIMMDINKKTLVADFGIAKLENSNLTLDGSIIGTPSYMSPEQCLGKGVDVRSDLFSTGSVLYQLLTGQKPFEGDNYMDTMRKVLEDSPPKPSQLKPKISAKVDALIEKALAKKSENRFQTAEAFQDALKDALIMPFSSSPKKKTGIIIASTLMAGVLGVGSYLYFSKNQKPVAIPEKLSITVPEFIFDKDKFIQLFADFECSNLQVDFTNEKVITLTGQARPEDLDLLESKVKQLTANTPYEFQVESKVRPYCSQELLLLEAEQRNKSQKHGLQLEPYNHDNLYIEGEFIEYEIITPDYDAYIYVDYYQSDGRVVHLVPNATIKLPISAYQQIVLGESDKGQKWEVFPPFGQDMVSIIASSIPLFAANRDEMEATDVYMADLKKTLLNNQASTLTASHFFVNTGPK